MSEKPKWIVKEGRKIRIPNMGSKTEGKDKPAPTNGLGNAFDIGVILGKAASQPKGESGIAYVMKHENLHPLGKVGGDGSWQGPRPKEFPCPVCDVTDMHDACEKCLGREADGFKACPYGSGTKSKEGQFPCNGCGALELLGSLSKCKGIGATPIVMDCARNHQMYI